MSNHPRPRFSSQPPAPPPHLEIEHVDGRSVIGAWNNVFVMVFRDVPSADWLRLAGEREAAFAARHPEGFVVLAVLPSMLLNLPSDVRDEAERLSRHRSPYLQAIALVIEGTGFVAAAVRSVASGISMLSRDKTPMRTFNNVEPASAWIATFLERERRVTAPRLLSEAVKNSTA